jgi:DNA integration/recombination/inversion protein
MPKTPKPLNDKEVKAYKPKEKRQKIADGNGLYLFIEPNSRKYFVFQYTSPIDKKRKMLVLGDYPKMTLKNARDEAFELLSSVKKGIDPRLKNTLDEEAKFKTLALKYLQIKNISDRTLRGERRRLENHIFPYIGDRDIKTITEAEIIEVLRLLEKKNKLETLNRLFSLLNQIYKSASHITPNIIQNINYRYTFKNNKTNNYPTLTSKKEINLLVENIKNYNGDIRTRYALKLSILTALRPMNVRMLKWGQVDLNNEVLKIEAKAMKTRNEFILPLAKQTVELLREFREFNFIGDYVFSSAHTSKRPMSENTVNFALRRMGYAKDEIVAHGFRAMFSTICNENIQNHGLNFDIIEKCLAHKDKNKIRSAYNRALNLKEMKKLMQWWADWLEKLEE